MSASLRSCAPASCAECAFVLRVPSSLVYVCVQRLDFVHPHIVRACDFYVPLFSPRPAAISAGVSGSL